MMVAPRTGGANRNCEDFVEKELAQSPPARGARIETLRLLRGILHGFVAPRTGGANRNQRSFGVAIRAYVAPRTGGANRNSISCYSVAAVCRPPHGGRE